MNRIEAAMKRALVLDVVRGIIETTGTDIKLIVDPDMPQVMTMETGFIITRVVR